MTLKGTPERAKTEYLRLLDYISGQDKSFQLNGWLRVWHSLSEHLKQSFFRGRRGKDLELPVQWPDDGIFGHRVDQDGALLLFIRMTSSAKPVDKKKIPPGFVPSAGHIEFNWSETLATYFFQAGCNGPSVKLVELFPDPLEHILSVYHEDFQSFIGETAFNQKAIEDKKERTPRKDPLQLLPPIVGSASASSSAAATLAIMGLPVAPSALASDGAGAGVKSDGASSPSADGGHEKKLEPDDKFGLEDVPQTPKPNKKAQKDEVIDEDPNF